MTSIIATKKRESDKKKARREGMLKLGKELEDNILNEKKGARAVVVDAIKKTMAAGYDVNVLKRNPKKPADPILQPVTRLKNRLYTFDEKDLQTGKTKEKYLVLEINRDQENGSVLDLNVSVPKARGKTEFSLDYIKNFLEDVGAEKPADKEAQRIALAYIMFSRCR